MNKTKSQTTSVDDFYDYCRMNNKLTEEDVDKLLTLAAINNDEVTDIMLRGYLPLSWAACVRIAHAMEANVIANYVDQLSAPLVHLPNEHPQGLWAI